MNHEPECTAWGESKINPTTCYACGIARAAYQRGREDAAKAVMEKAVPFGLDHMELFRFNCAEAARGDEN